MIELLSGDEFYDDDVTSGIQETGACESGWTGDRCTFRLHHAGPHSNETRDPLWPCGDRPMCRKCGDRPVYLAGLCGTCWSLAGEVG